MKEKPTYEELQRLVHELKTDNTQLENKLLEARSLTEEIMTYMTEGLVLTDTRETVIFINQRLSEMLGYLSEEVIGKCWLDMVSVEQQAIAHEAKARRAHGHIDRYEIVMRRKSGEKFSALIGAGPRFDKLSGQYIGSMAVVTDITERKRAEQRLQRQTVLFQNLFKNSPDAIAVLDHEDRVLEINRSFETLFGYSHTEAQGREINDLLAPEPYRGDAQSVSEKVIGEVRVVEKEAIRCTKGGRPVDVSLIGYPLVVDQQKIGAYAIYRDITERNRAVKQLHLAHQTLLAILDGIDATVYVVDMDSYEILFMNKNMIDAFGGDFTGRLCYQVFRAIGHPCDHCTNDRLLDAQGQPTDVCTWESRNSITKKWYINYDRAIRWHDDRIVKLQIATDITELKQAENEKEKLQAQLTQAQKMEAVGTLAGGIAHDFNNILGAILGYAEMVQDDCPTGSTMRNDIDRVVEASHRAKELVKQILAFSRQAESEERVLQPALIIKEVMKMLRASLPKTIDIQQNIDPDAGLILADPTQIHQIITNLCTNAFHAMEETGGILNISLKNKEFVLTDLVSEPHVQPGHFIEISVGDTGPGIAPELMDKIFDPFFTTKEVGKGTGMGLAIIHGIAKKAGGFVSCKSSLGVGTTFHVYYQIHADTTPPEAETTPFELIETGIERILFIDDEEMLAEMGKTMLERLGYRVTAETNSIEALKMIQSQPDRFDLVITDQTMPGMTGSDLARRILQIRPDLSIILCTGFSNQISEEKAMMYGIKGFAMKPLAKKDLAALVRKVLDGEK